MNFDDLIGLEESEARKILAQNGYNNINTFINSKEDNKCNKALVCAVKQADDGITLICGEFYILKEI